MKKKNKQDVSFLQFLFESRVFIAGAKMPRPQYTESEIDKWSLPRIILIPVIGLLGFALYNEWGAIIGVLLFLAFSYVQYLFLKRRFK